VQPKLNKMMESIFQADKFSITIVMLIYHYGSNFKNLKMLSNTRSSLVKTRDDVKNNWDWKKEMFTTRAVRMVLLSAVSVCVCVCVCLSVNMVTPELLKDITKFSGHHL